MKTLKLFCVAALLLTFAYVSSGCWTGSAKATVKLVGTAKAVVTSGTLDTKTLNSCLGSATASSSYSTSASSLHCQASVTSSECQNTDCMGTAYWKCTGTSVSKTIKSDDDECNAYNSCRCIEK